VVRTKLIAIKPIGELRSQWHHVIDVVPAILDACKTKKPNYVNGIKQKPLESVKSPLPKGKVVISTQFIPDGTPQGSGTVKLMVNGQIVGEGKMARTAFRHGLEPFEVGRDTGTPVDPAYQSKGEFPFTGKN
jgi:hypothetical protein